MDQHPNRQNGSILQDISISLPDKKVKDKSEIKKNIITRTLYIIGGTLSLILAILGVVVPGLPVTPLVLLSAFLYAKSSKKLYNWLLNNKIFGEKIKNYQRQKGVTRKGKVKIVAFMTIMVLFSSFVVVDSLTLRWIIISLGFIGLVVVVFFVPNAKEESNGTVNN